MKHKASFSSKDRSLKKIKVSSAAIFVRRFIRAKSSLAKCLQKFVTAKITKN